MCDCYEQKCTDKNCNIIIPVHISDFCTSRDNVKPYCKKHITDRCLVFQIPKGYRDETYQFPRNYKFGFEVIDTSKVEGFNTKHSINYKSNQHPVVSPNLSDWDWVK